MDLVGEIEAEKGRAESLPRRAREAHRAVGNNREAEQETKHNPAQVENSRQRAEEEMVR